MVTSATYRQSSKPTAKLADAIPKTRLFGRMNRRRLDAEGVRDAMLAVSGELNSRMHGPGVLAPIEKEIEDLVFTEAEAVDLWPEDRNPSEHLRRSIYLFRTDRPLPPVRRFRCPRYPDACPRRATSTHALQALALLNSEFASGRARSLASRVLREGRCRRRQESNALEFVPAREPSHDEFEPAKGFLTAQTDLIRKGRERDEVC